ncbi:hypothetical protein L208DRAFT_1389916 [Tricholoma matsutake]|nr:hypothetical protein L208DRAFT_1389916 [Tricholoma matsutake 945]
MVHVSGCFAWKVSFAFFGLSLSTAAATAMFSPAKQLLATPHTQASIMKIKAARRSMATQGLEFPIMRVTVTVGNVVKLMYCDGTQPARKASDGNGT